MGPIELVGANHDLEPPLTGLVRDWPELGADPAIGDLEHPVPDLREQHTETCALRPVAAFAEVDCRVRSHRQIEEVGNPDLCGAKPVPPCLHEAAPGRTFRVRGLKGLIEIAE